MPSKVPSAKKPCSDQRVEKEIHKLLSTLIERTKDGTIAWRSFMQFANLPRVVFAYTAQIDLCQYTIFVMFNNGLPEEIHFDADNMAGGDSLYIGPDHFIYTDQLMELYEVVTGIADDERADIVRRFIDNVQNFSRPPASTEPSHQE